MGKFTVQQVQFNTEQFTEEQCVQWLTEHRFKVPKQAKAITIEDNMRCYQQCKHNPNKQLSFMFELQDFVKPIRQKVSEPRTLKANEMCKLCLSKKISYDDLDSQEDVEQPQQRSPQRSCYEQHHSLAMI